MRLAESSWECPSGEGCEDKVSPSRGPAGRVRARRRPRTAHARDLRTIDGETLPRETANVIHVPTPPESTKRGKTVKSRAFQYEAFSIAMNYKMYTVYTTSCTRCTETPTPLYLGRPRTSASMMPFKASTTVPLDRPLQRLPCTTNHRGTLAKMCCVKSFDRFVLARVSSGVGRWCLYASGRSKWARGSVLPFASASARPTGMFAASLFPSLKAPLRTIQERVDDALEDRIQRALKPISSQWSRCASSSTDQDVLRQEPPRASVVLNRPTSCRSARGWVGMGGECEGRWGACQRSRRGRMREQRASTTADRSTDISSMFWVYHEGELAEAGTGHDDSEERRKAVQRFLARRNIDEVPKHTSPTPLPRMLPAKRKASSGELSQQPGYTGRLGADHHPANLPPLPNVFIRDARALPSRATLDAHTHEEHYEHAQEGAADDAAYFLAICRPTQKLVPFIAVLDNQFESFKKDSLWAAEEVDAVFDQDPQRVCILRGPVAVKWSKVPVVDYCQCPPCTLHKADGKVAFHTGAPSAASWLESLAGPELSWRPHLLEVHCPRRLLYQQSPPPHRILIPHPRQKVIVDDYTGDVPLHLSAFGGARDPDFKAVDVAYDAASKEINLTLFKERRFAPIHEFAEGRNDRIKAFYWKLWYGDSEALPNINVRDVVKGAEVTSKAEDVEQFCQFCAVVGNQQPGRGLQEREETPMAPMDFAFVMGWQAFPSTVDGDLLKLVHLSNGFRMARILSVVNPDAGKIIKVKGHVLRAGKPIIEVVSAFLYHGKFTDFYEVALENDAQVSYKDKNPFSDMEVSSEIFVRNQLKALVKDLIERVLSYDVSFVGMVLPGDSLKVNIHHVAMHNGNLVVKTTNTNDRDEKVLEGSAEVARPPRLLRLHRHPNGLLFATQFAQMALVVTEKAAFEDMRVKGFVQKDCPFAGHSLGEYSALASIADVLHISALVDVAFYRGITMQRAVERDEHNRSNYAMCAVNPSRISKTFTDTALRDVVDGIASSTNQLLEIVNFNVEGQQYVCAGELVALQTLTNVLNYLKVKKVDIVQLTQQFSVEKVKEMLGEIIKSSHDSAVEKQKSDGYIILERGFATIPLPGIDVPFHSRYLWAGVMPFRTYLSKKINPAHLNPDTLIGKYIPNLIAQPFDISREYAQIIYDRTSSPRLDKVLKNWEEEKWGSTDNRQKLAYVILVELLAYQFASPVRWIETQDLLFTDFAFAFERLAKYEASDDSVGRKRAILCHAKHPKEIYYQFEDEPEDAPAEEPASADAPAAPTAAPAAAAAPAPVAAPSGPVASVEDVPIKPVDVLAVIVAQKLKKTVSEIPLSKSMGGKSTLQNEILGDLHLEFTSAPEKGEELPLEELGSSLQSGGGLGKHTSGLVSRLIGGKMPGGFNASAIKSYLSKTWGLGPLRADARLASEAEGRAWVDSVVSAYAQRAGISLAAPGAASGGGGGGGAGPTINSEEFIKFQADQQKFAAQHVELYMRYLGRDSRAGELAFDQEKANSQALQAKLDSILREHGDTYIDGIQPAFDPLKARHFNSSWNWARQDALLMFYDIIFGRLTTYYIDKCDPERGETFKLAKHFGQQLIDNTREVVGKEPLYKDLTFPTAPHTEITAKGDIVYTEVVQDDVAKLWTLVKSQPGITEEQKKRIKALYEGVVRSLRKGPDSPRPRVTPRTRCSSSQVLRPQLSAANVSAAQGRLDVGVQQQSDRCLPRRPSRDCYVWYNLQGQERSPDRCRQGLHRGRGRQGPPVRRCPRRHRDFVIVIATSRYTRSTVEYYQDIYQTYGARGFALIPFNQGSKQDVEALVDYIYANLGLDLDYILPFAGIPENGREIDSIDDKSELAQEGEPSVRHAPPMQVILPLSPNHGLFGNDGLYSESKISLEMLFQRWASESWGEYLCLALPVRSLLDPWYGSHGSDEHCRPQVLRREMAFNIFGLMHPLLFSITQVEPRRAITLDTSADFKVKKGPDAERQTINVLPRANHRYEFPALESTASLADVSSSPVSAKLALGVARTHWEMEARGELTIEGCIEMAWIMGFIKHFNGPPQGWYTGATSYEILAHWCTPHRYVVSHLIPRSQLSSFAEPELFRGYDPKKKVFNQEIELTHDLEPIEVVESETQKFKLQHGDKCDIWAGEEGQWFAKLKKGACVYVPKVFKFSRTVAGQIPTGWSAGCYGIPDDIVAQTDRVTLWALHIHPSEIGTSLGSGMGGVVSMAKMFKDRRDEKDVQNDILQETFINTTAGWINLLLLSSSGPAKIPVGTCATALQSVEIACDTILSGKAKVMLAGGFDDLSEEGSYEFANMKATSNAETEFAMGREPTEMSRPATSTRSGFMESQGSGVQVLMSARTALELGAPIRGIVAFTSTSTDKAGRSIPAPGRVPSTQPLPILDIKYRTRQLEFRRKQISQWLTHEHYQLQEFRKQEGAEFTEEELTARVDSIEKEAARQEKDALAVFGMLEGSDPHVAPLRRALAVWGLTTDDVGVLSIHGTSTGANKSLLGHSKGGSAAWQMAGLLQSVYHGIIPGNRNSDNIDPMFQDRHFLMFPSKTIYTAGIKAGLMSSFGFGQVGGTILILHPRFVFGALDPAYYEAYKARNHVRALQSYKAMSDMMVKHSLVKVKDASPYTPDLEGKVPMNSLASTIRNPRTGKFEFGKINSTVKQDTANVKAVSELLSSGGLSESASRGNVTANEVLPEAAIPAKTAMTEKKCVGKDCHDGNKTMSRPGQNSIPPDQESEYAHVVVQPECCMDPDGTRHSFELHKAPPDDPHFLTTPSSLMPYVRTRTKKEPTSVFAEDCLEEEDEDDEDDVSPPGRKRREQPTTCPTCANPHQPKGLQTHFSDRNCSEEAALLEQAAEASREYANLDLSPDDRPEVVVNKLKIRGEAYLVYRGKELVVVLNDDILHRYFAIRVCYATEGHSFGMFTSQHNTIISQPFIRRGKKSKGFPVPYEYCFGLTGSPVVTILMALVRPEHSLVFADHNVLMSFHVMRLRKRCSRDDLKPGHPIWPRIWSASHGPCATVEPEEALRTLKNWRINSLANKKFNSTPIGLVMRQSQHLFNGLGANESCDVCCLALIPPYAAVTWVLSNQAVFDRLVRTYLAFSAAIPALVASWPDTIVPVRMVDDKKHKPFAFNSHGHTKFLHTAPCYRRKAPFLKVQLVREGVRLGLYSPTATFVAKATDEVYAREASEGEAPYKPMAEELQANPLPQPRGKSGRTHVPNYIVVVDGIEYHTPYIARPRPDWKWPTAIFRPTIDVSEIKLDSTLGPYSFNALCQMAFSYRESEGQPEAVARPHRFEVCGMGRKKVPLPQDLTISKRAFVPSSRIALTMNGDKREREDEDDSDGPRKKLKLTPLTRRWNVYSAGEGLGRPPPSLWAGSYESCYEPSCQRKQRTFPRHPGASLTVFKYSNDADQWNSTNLELESGDDIGLEAAPTVALFFVAPTFHEHLLAGAQDRDPKTSYAQFGVDAQYVEWTHKSRGVAVVAQSLERGG
ncbi:uncharacterized protein SCHCODRAFT_01176814 [Schizophyllum commune H4-8]|uniref:uncharacterized protein n=1 Tax=Schizophyllum commune (strain H4-8 / FGSC 9210) TaxID=578458 RepID=UPI00216037E8|nr:uncharacterized protein SCHCODRAFT_01176814 [Schizophyllum commune H4-8]KAI5885432.1 hypothetical protein SCHCODRAFT_01176814 [Schizophyllum commune H4-8]